MINIDDAKWRDLNTTLTKERGDGEKFESVYLVDDLTASGTTFIRRDPDNGEWTGKLKRFNDLVRHAKGKLNPDFPVTEGYAVHIHHYISSHKACPASM